jgi:hypothetical protein
MFDPLRKDPRFQKLANAQPMNPTRFDWPQKGVCPPWRALSEN